MIANVRRGSDSVVFRAQIRVVASAMVLTRLKLELCMEVSAVEEPRLRLVAAFRDNLKGLVCVGCPGRAVVTGRPRKISILAEGVGDVGDGGGGGGGGGGGSSVGGVGSDGSEGGDGGDSGDGDDGGSSSGSGGGGNADTGARTAATLGGAPRRISPSVTLQSIVAVLAAAAAAAVIF